MLLTVSPPSLSPVRTTSQADVFCLIRPPRQAFVGTPSRQPTLAVLIYGPMCYPSGRLELFDLLSQGCHFSLGGYISQGVERHQAGGPSDAEVLAVHFASEGLLT